MFNAFNKIFKPKFCSSSVSCGGLFKRSQPARFLHTSAPRQGWLATVRFITLNARSRGQRLWYRRFKPNHKQWQAMKWHLNDLIMKQRLHLTLPWAKELQQYAEELIYLAKKNDPHNNGMVESMLMSPAAREILYEKLVPRYRDRPFHFTRIVNKFQLRDRDAAKMGFIEFIDRPGEHCPAPPAGDEKVEYVKSVMEYGTRRERRKMIGEAQNMGLVPKHALSSGPRETNLGKSQDSSSSSSSSGNRLSVKKSQPTFGKMSPIGLRPSKVVEDLGPERANRLEARSTFRRYLARIRAKSFEDIQRGKAFNRRRRAAAKAKSDSIAGETSDYDGIGEEERNPFLDASDNEQRRLSVSMKGANNGSNVEQRAQMY